MSIKLTLLKCDAVTYLAYDECEINVFSVALGFTGTVFCIYLVFFSNK